MSVLTAGFGTGALSLAASGVAALPRALTSTLLPRVVGIYIAAAAGTIQLLDIVVDRMQLDDRLFTFAIVLAVIGIPLAAAGALLADTARAERRRPDTSRGTTYRDVADVAQQAPALPPFDRTAEGGALHRRLDIALSYRHLAALSEDAGEAAEAAAQQARAAAELHSLIADLEKLLPPNG